MDEAGWRGIVHSASEASWVAPVAVSVYAIVGAFWQTLLVGAQGENCAVSSRDPWEGVAILGALGCLALFGAGCVAIYIFRMRREGMQLLLSGALLVGAVALLVLVAAADGYLSCP
jgi:hypothetical protein